MSGFSEEKSWGNPVDTIAHCSRILKLFFSMENREFLRKYGELPYPKSHDVPPNSIYVENMEGHMAARSGILNRFECRVSKTCMRKFSLFKICK